MRRHVGRQECIQQSSSLQRHPLSLRRNLLLYLNRQLSCVSSQLCMQLRSNFCRSRSTQFVRQGRSKRLRCSQRFNKPWLYSQLLRCQQHRWPCSLLSLL